VCPFLKALFELRHFRFSVLGFTDRLGVANIEKENVMRHSRHSHLPLYERECVPMFS
jgi:hypothetical protein